MKNFFEELLFFLLRKIVAVPFGKTRTSVSTDQEKAMNHFDI